MDPIEYFNQFGFIIFDECHLYGNKFHSKAFTQAQAPYMLGLSATPTDAVFAKIPQWGIGQIIKADTIQGYEEKESNFKAEVTRVNYYGPDSHTRQIRNEKTGLVSVVETISMICDDTERQNIVIDCILKCIRANLFTYVFSDRREYLLQLKALLSKKSNADADIMFDDNDYIRLVGGSKTQDFDKATKDGRVIFTTYQFMGTGKSIVKMNAVVLATPRKSKIEQYVGRIFRLGSDESVTRQIYDIVDMKTVLKNQWYVRKKYYASQGYQIKTNKIEQPQEPDLPDENPRDTAIYFKIKQRLMS
jgi:superfamily II DNA or RNA helicase